MTKLEELKAAFEASTPGEYEVTTNLNGDVLLVTTTGYSIATKFRDDGAARRDARFIALARNLMPDLIKAAEELRIAAYLLQNEYPEHDENWQRAQQMLDLLEKFK